MTRRRVLLIMLSAIAVGCGRNELPNPPSAARTPTKAPKMPSTGAADWATGRRAPGPPPDVAASEVPALPDNAAVEPVGPVTEGQLTVVPIVKPRLLQRAALLDLDDPDNPKLLVTDVLLTSGIWSAEPGGGLFSGRVTLSLAENQWAAARAVEQLGVQPMP